MPPEISDGRQRLVFDLALGGRATSWTVQGDDGRVLELLTRHSDADIDHGMYVMAPWAGRIRGNAVGAHLLAANFGPWAIHGTVPWRPVEVSARSAASITFEQELTGWPYGGAVQMSWTLADGALETTIRVRSRGPAFPATVGWHPWLPRELAGAAAVVELPATEQLVRGDDALPTGDRTSFGAQYGTYDDAFVVPEQRASIDWPGVSRLEVRSSAPWFVLFDQLPDALCIEPQSGPPDGLRSTPFFEPMLVTAEQPLELRARWSVTLP